MTLPIANGLAGSAGHALPEDAVCDWKGRDQSDRLRLEGIPDLLASARTVGMKMP
ncbi:hypothetical protein JOD69_004004 [Methylocaldum sp. RMAD-M]|nr:hypothetical protein [Methylocaldum sp. RMAD-M]